jgi:hypothetical protein
MIALTQQEAMIHNTTQAAAEEVILQSPITLGEARDFVMCLYATVNTLTFEERMLKDHMKECTDEECAAQCKINLKELQNKREVLMKRTAKLAPIVMHKHEQLEAKVAEKLKLL